MGVSTIASLFVGINALAITSALPNSPVAGQVNGKPPQVDGQGALPVADNMGDTYTSSFTYNYECTGPTMACGPNWNNDPSGGAGSLEPNLDRTNVGMAAVNTWLYYNNWNGPNANLNKNWGGGCGQCWELTPKSEYNYHNMQPTADLLPVGKPIIVTITDICTDGGTGDQQPGSTNSWGQEVHFDICRANNDVWKDFFGNGTNGNGNFPGQIIGSAKRVDCPKAVPQFGSECTDAAMKAKPDNCPPPGSGTKLSSSGSSDSSSPSSSAAANANTASSGPASPASSTSVAASSPSPASSGNKDQAHQADGNQSDAAGEDEGDECEL